MKDKKLEQLFDDYLKGTNLPEISLKGAKNLIEEKKAKRKRSNKWVIAFASFACAVIVILSAVFIVSGTQTKYYDVASLTETPTTFMSIKENNSECFSYISKLDIIENVANASADYFLYYDGDKIELLKVVITTITPNGAEKAIIYIEFTDKKYTGSDFKPYYELENKGKYYGKQYKFSEEEVAGEWVSKAYLEKNDIKYFFDIQSPNKDALEKYFEII